MKKKAPKSVSLKENLNLKNFKNYLEATQLEKKINCLEKDKVIIDILKKIIIIHKNQ